MLFIAILSFLATLSFRKELVKRGYTSSRLWLKPIIWGAAIILIAHYLGSILLAVAIQNGAWPSVLSFLINALTIVIYLSLIARSWKEIQQLESKDSISEEGNSKRDIK